MGGYTGGAIVPLVGIDIVIKPCSRLPCACETFAVNGVESSYEIFIEMYDHDSENADSFCCEQMYGDRLPLNVVRANIRACQPEIAWLSDEEILEIQEELYLALHVGSCGLCA